MGRINEVLKATGHRMHWFVGWKMETGREESGGFRVDSAVFRLRALGEEAEGLAPGRGGGPEVRTEEAWGVWSTILRRRLVTEAPHPLVFPVSRPLTWFT